MPAVAKAALVSEATAYRYFPDLFSLLLEAFEGTWPEPAEAMKSGAGSSDPVERIGCATQALMRKVIETHGDGAVISESVIRPQKAVSRPSYGVGLIDFALAPLAARANIDRSALAELKQELLVVLGAEVLFRLTDVCGLPADQAIATAMRIAQTLTEAAVRGPETRQRPAPKPGRDRQSDPTE